MKYLLLFLSMVLYFTSHAQQDPLYAQYINNPLVINPAYSGLPNNLNVSASYRQQWGGFEGAPKTINANAHTSLSNNKMGLGVMVVSDQIGASTTNEFFVTYAYRIGLGESSTLSFGLQGGVSNFQNDNSKLNVQDASDPLFQGTTSMMKGNFGAGIILSGDRYFVSLSVPRMLKSTNVEDGVEATLYTQHFYAFGSYLFSLSENFKLKPSALVKYASGAPTSVDVNATGVIRNNYQVGVLSRNFNTYGFLVQAVLADRLRLGYVFEVPMETSIGTSFPTHEVTLGIRMKIFKSQENSAYLF